MTTTETFWRIEVKQYYDGSDDWYWRCYDMTWYKDHAERIFNHVSKKKEEVRIVEITEKREVVKEKWGLIHN